MILYSTQQVFWGDTALTLAVVILEAATPFHLESPPDMFGVWKINHELAAFPWVGGNPIQENQGAVNKLYLSIQFYFPFSRQS